MTCSSHGFVIIRQTAYKTDVSRRYSHPLSGIVFLTLIVQEQSPDIMKTKLIVVAGPTAVGKQRLELNWPSVLMAKLFQEIASRFTDN